MTLSYTDKYKIFITSIIALHCMLWPFLTIYSIIHTSNETYNVTIYSKNKTCDSNHVLCEYMIVTNLTSYQDIKINCYDKGCVNVMDNLVTNDTYPLRVCESQNFMNDGCWCENTRLGMGCVTRYILNNNSYVITHFGYAHILLHLLLWCIFPLLPVLVITYCYISSILHKACNDNTTTANCAKSD
jgi:hypothetical protein